MFDKRNDSKQGDPKENLRNNPPKSSNAASPAMVKAAVIGPGITISGDISGTESLYIEGKVEGKINLPGHQVEIGKAGRVAADIVGKFVKVDGKLKGDIVGKEKVVLAKSGNMQGNIVAPRVMLEDGAIFKGSIDINPVDSTPVELPLSPQKSTANVKPLGGESSKKETGIR